MNRAKQYDDIYETMNTTALHSVVPFLRCVKGPSSCAEIRLPDTGLLIGRDPVSCALFLANDLDVSRYHCRVSYQKRTGFFIVTDLNSTNGVYTEKGQRLPAGGKIALIDGQCFSLCQGRYVFQTVLRLSY